MADYVKMWEDLGMDINNHDNLCQVLPTAVGDVFMTQENRPKAMDFWDMVIAEVHGIRLADELEQRIKDGVSVVPEGTKRILITGTPLAVPNWKLHNIIETSGAAVVCEEMCTGTRYFENLVDESGETLDEQFMNLSRRYMKTNCACFTPNTGRIDDILRMVDEYQVDGVIDCSLMFCCLYDTEKRAVAEALKEKNIPVLSLETDYTDTDAEQLRTRIGAFVEMLSK